MNRNNYSYLPNEQYWRQRIADRNRKVENEENIMFKQYKKVYREVLDDYTSKLKPNRQAGGTYNFERLQQDKF